MIPKDKLLLIGYVGFPLIIFTGGVIHQAQKVTFFALCFFLVAFMIQNIWLRAFVFYLGTWLLYLLVSYLFSAATNVPVNMSIMFCMYMVLAIIVFSYVVHSKTSKEIFYNAICAGAIVQSVLAILQLWDLDPIFQGYNWIVDVKHGMDKTAAVGTLGNNNFYAAYITMSLPFFFRKWWWYCIPPLIAMLFAAITSTAIVATMVGCAWYFWPKLRKRWIALGLLPFMAWLLIYKQSWTIYFFDRWQDLDRIQWWIAAIKQTCGHWLGVLFGMGPSAPWGGAFPIHNEWVTIFHHFGLVGCFLAGGYILTINRTNRMAYAAFLISCVNAMGTYPWHLAPTAMLTLLIIGLLEREKVNAD